MLVDTPLRHRRKAVAMTTTTALYRYVRVCVVVTAQRFYTTTTVAAVRFKRFVRCRPSIILNALTHKQTR